MSFAGRIGHVKMQQNSGTRKNIIKEIVQRASSRPGKMSSKRFQLRLSNAGNIFRGTCRTTMLRCKVRWFVARIAIFLRKVDVAFTFCNMKIYLHKKVVIRATNHATYNATLLRDKLHKKCCPYY